MTILVPCPLYSKDELNILYPRSLKLQLVQIVRGTKYGEIVVLPKENLDHAGKDSHYFQV